MRRVARQREKLDARSSAQLAEETGMDNLGIVVTFTLGADGHGGPGRQLALNRWGRSNPTVPTRPSHANAA